MSYFNVGLLRTLHAGTWKIERCATNEGARCIVGGVRCSCLWLGVSFEAAVNTLVSRGHLSAGSGAGLAQVQATLFVLSSQDLFAQLLMTEPKPRASSTSSMIRIHTVSNQTHLGPQQSSERQSGSGALIPPLNGPLTFKLDVK